MNSKNWKIVKRALGCLMLSLLVVSPIAFAGEGGGGSTGGGFMDFNGKKILKAALIELNALAPTIQTPTLQAYPQRRQTLIQALGSVQVRSKENRIRDGQKLVMDYDLGRQQITALKPFFEGFQTSAVSRESITGAEQLLLHEVAHLWGDNDIEGDAFANEFLAALAQPQAPPTPHVDPALAIRAANIARWKSVASQVLAVRKPLCGSILYVDEGNSKVMQESVANPWTGRYCTVAGQVNDFQCTSDFSVCTTTFGPNRYNCSMWVLSSNSVELKCENTGTSILYLP